MRKWILSSALLVALAVTAWPLAVHGDDPPTVHEVASELMCQCGCGLTVATCQESMACSVAEGIVQDIRRQIEAGKSKEEILDYFASIYGEGVLALPRKSGFSLTAWATPFLAVGAGGVAVAALAWLWVRRRSAAAKVAAMPGEDLSAYEERVEEDLRLLE